jgi:hypothetical protein
VESGCNFFADSGDQYLVKKKQIWFVPNFVHLLCYHDSTNDAVGIVSSLKHREAGVPRQCDDRCNDNPAVKRRVNSATSGETRSDMYHSLNIDRQVGQSPLEFAGCEKSAGICIDEAVFVACPQRSRNQLHRRLADTRRQTAVSNDGPPEGRPSVLRDSGQSSNVSVGNQSLSKSQLQFTIGTSYVKSTASNDSPYSGAETDMNSCDSTADEDATQLQSGATCITREEGLTTKEVTDMINGNGLHPRIQQRIPNGPTNNVYFLLENAGNVMRRQAGGRSIFRDDCSIWCSEK